MSLVQRGLVLYEHGDHAVASREFQPLAQRGNVLTQYKLDPLIDNGEGVQQDFDEAVK